MSDIDEQQINATLTELNKTLVTDGALVRFSAASGSTEPLQKALIKVFDIYFNTKGQEAAAKAKQQIQNGKEAEQTAKKVASAQLNGIKKFLSKQKEKEKISNDKSWSNLSSYLDELKSGDDKKKKLLAESLGQLIGTYKVAKEMFTVISKIGMAIYDISKDRIELLASLKESGISLKEGFDESFYKLTSISGKTVEQFADLLKKNSKFNAQLNANNLNGSYIIANQAKVLRESLGLTRNEIDNVITYFGDMMHTAANDARLTNIDFNTEIASTAKMLKELAIATGQSTEQIIAHAKEQAKTWQMERLRKDPRYAGQYAALKAIGVSDEIIEHLLLNKVNKASTELQLTAGGRQADIALQQWVRATKGMTDKSAIARALLEVVNGPGFDLHRQQEAWLNDNMQNVAAYMGPNGEKIFSAAQFLGYGTKADIASALRALDQNNPETSAIREYSEFNKSLNDLKTTLNQAIAPGLKASADFFRIISGPLKVLAAIAEKVPKLAAVGYWGFQIASALGSGFLNVVTPVMAMNYLSGGQIMGEKMTGLITKGMAKTFKFGAFLLKGAMIAGIGAGAGALAAGLSGGDVTGGTIGGTIGSVVGGVAGSFFGPAGTYIGAAAGGTIGGLIGGHIGNDKKDSYNEPALNQMSDDYVNDYSQPSNSIIKPAPLETTNHEISVVGTESIKSLLRESISTQKEMLSLYKNAALKTGTNISA